MRYKIVTTKNIVSLSSGFQESQKREPGIPRMGLIYAPTGFGKSTAAAWLVNREQGIYVRALSGRLVAYNADRISFIALKPC
jgi:hypothetical protein